MITMEVNGNEYYNNDMYMDESPPPSNDYMECDIFGEQVIFPRIGQDYQVDIPMLLKRSNYLSNPRSLTESTNFKLTSFQIHHSEVNGEESTEPELGFVCHSWSDAEKDSFLLGLYIFSRNFVQLKRFLESIKMEDILLYYYGSFYRSNEYRQWSECRKTRKKGVVGQKIFTGLRQEEFISRVISNNISEECKNAVLEVCRMFGEEKMTLDEYIFSMKNLVGIKALVEGVGIGKGKKDLTTMALEPSRTNQIMPAAIPTGKECASLTFSDIVKYLTGNYRLSKARSNDLFWEAVWPRLLAKGWHSEEAKEEDQFYASGKKKGLVFLVPGIVKFSRRNLTNGNHYFDSVTDVLKKVALDPGLIKLEEEEEDNVKRHCYLQPRSSFCVAAATDAMKFTVVDTSLDDGKSFRVIRELRSFSFGFSYNVDSTRHIEINDVYNTDSQGYVRTSNREVLSDMKNLDNNDPMQVPNPCPDPEHIPASKNIHTCEDENRNMKEDDDKDLVKSVQEIMARDDLKQVNQASCLAVHHDVVEIVDFEEGIQIQNNIDLNLPTEINGDHDEINKGTTLSEKQQFNVNPQRRGTRNRPPTTRALEAVAFGLLSVNTKCKGKSGKFKEKQNPRPSRRARSEAELSHVQIDHFAPVIQHTQSGANTDCNNRPPFSSL